MGVGHRNCVVVGCLNNGKKMNKWLGSDCEIHHCKRATEGCDCKPPFRLFPFPTEKKNLEARKRWTKLFKRVEPSGKPWFPTKSSRVCSDHFISGQPTTNDPDPALNLGYERCQHRKRKEPTDRSGLPAIKTSKKAKSESPVLEIENHGNINGDIAIENKENDNDENKQTHQTCDENKQNILHDHGYSYGWSEIYDSNYCSDLNCLARRKDKDEEIKRLQATIDELNKDLDDCRTKLNNCETKLAICQSKLHAKTQKGLRYTDIETDKCLKLLTGIPSIEAFEILYDVLQNMAKKVYHVL